ncbi:SMI1/KNR4 family protein [Streptomyces sp. NPDC007910]|uniref:SMI1/KNR4 family protein n=1 Tax=Streptomyces sp. NPDC007910 TaxID=3364790 RepID=UPI0036E98D4F
MTSDEDLRFPPALAAALAVRSPHTGGDGVDFEPFPAFLPAGETTEWIRAWTGNEQLTGEDFRVFGQDGTGGYAAFWLVRPDRALEGQPVVFLGSEGETGVVANDLGSFLWLLADGVGPWEATNPYGPVPASYPHPELTAVAERYAPGLRAPAADLIGRAAREFPGFDDVIAKLCG